MKKIFKILTAIAVLPLLWLTFVQVFLMNFKIDPITFEDEDI